MAQRRTFWAVIAVSLLLLSFVSWASIANLGLAGRVYCDYLRHGESSCQMNNIPTSFSILQPAPLLPPVRNFSDGELSIFVLAKDILTRPVQRQGNSKVAFMFLTGAELPFEHLWETFFKVNVMS